MGRTAKSKPKKKATPKNSDHQNTQGFNAAEIKGAADAATKKEEPLTEKQKADLKFKSVLLMVSAALVLLLVFIPGSSGWKWMHNGLLGLFGVSVLTWPIVLVLAGLFLQRQIQGQKPKEHRPKNVCTYFLYGMGIAVLVSSTVQVWFGEALRTKNPIDAIIAFYHAGQDNPLFNGGAISVLAYILSALLGSPGDKICVLFVLFLVVMWLMGWDMLDLKDWVCRAGGFLRNLLFPTKDALPAEKDVPDLEEPKKISFFSNLFQKAEEQEQEAEAVQASETQNTQELDAGEIIAATDGLAETPIPPQEPPLQEPFQMQYDAAVEPTLDVEPPEPEEPIFEPESEQMPRQLDLFQEQGMGAIVPENAMHPEQEEPAYQIPSLSLLKRSNNTGKSPEIQQELERNKRMLEETLKDFNVGVSMKDVQRGPSVTRYEVQPNAGVKVSKITGLSDDIALNLSAQSIRIEAPVPGKSVVGIEVPNRKKDVVKLRDILESDAFQNAKSQLAFAVGKDIAGNAIIGDIAKMPHLIIAGATGSGKSVCTNSIIMSILFHATPEQVRLILIDPKIVEFRVYEDIPHLLIPVVTDPKKAAGALNWAVQEMEHRYQAFADNGVRDLADYNKKIRSQPDGQTLPQIVIAIDELADLMMTASKEVEDAICRLAQKARAAGMHLIIATQRPTTDIITGLIKANIPSRIALSVMSQVDSRTILDTGGAEKLLGHGDMLYLPNGMPKPIRVQGCFVSTEEIEKTVAFVKQQAQAAYDDSALVGVEQNIPVLKGETASPDGNADPRLEEAIQAVVELGQASTSSLQRYLNVGYARAARMIDELEKMGIVGGYNGAKPRKVLMTKQQYEERKMRNLP